MAASEIKALERFGDFEIVGELGRGGMGIVYEAYQISLKRRVALKVLSGRLGLTARAITRFKLEAEAAASLHHANIVPIFATGEQDGIPFYAMEFIDGPSLDRVIRQLKFSRHGRPLAAVTTRGQDDTPGTENADDQQSRQSQSDDESDTKDHDIDWSVETMIGPSDAEEIDQEQAVGQGETFVEPDAIDADAVTAMYVQVSGSDLEMDRRRSANGGSASGSLSRLSASRSSAVSRSATDDQSLSGGSQLFRNAARMLADVADALQHAHDRGIIHRDIKPGNLLLARDGRLCLNDFGLVRVLDAPGVTVSGEFVGSPLYMSPEQILSGRKPVDHRTDIYSLGATLYELIALQPPFGGQRRDEILTRILTKEPPEPRRINRKIPPDLETICLKALDKDPDRRYATAADMAADLRRFLQFEPILARRAGLLGRLLKWTRRRPAVAALSVCLLVLLLVSSVFGVEAWRSREQAEQERLTSSERQQQLISEQEARLAAEQEQERIRKAQQEAERERLRAEQDRQRFVAAEAALDDAVGEALNGRYDRIEEHVRRAESLGIAPGRAHLLRGLSAVESGSFQEALPHLQRAVDELPDSMAARVLLLRTCLSVGRSPELRELAAVQDREFRKLTPVTPLDQLYGAAALTSSSPDQAIQWLRELEQQQSAPAVQYMLGRAYFAQIQQTYELFDLEEMVRLIDAAQATQPGNVLAQRRRFLAHFLAADIYRLRKYEQERQHHLYIAREAAREMLIHHPEDARSYQVNAMLAAFDNEWDAALKYASDGQQLATSNDDAPDVTSFLHRAGQTAEALVGLGDEAGSFSGQLGIYRCFLIADCEGPEPAVQNFERWLQDLNPLAPPDRGMLVYSLFCYLGRPAEAVRQCRIYQQKIGPAPATDELTAAVDRFICGESDETALLELARSRGERIYAHYLVGLHHMGHGDRVAAIAEFEAVEREGFPAWGFNVADPSKGAAILLHRLRQDPSWPPWIPFEGGQTDVDAGG